MVVSYKHLQYFMKVLRLIILLIPLFSFVPSGAQEALLRNGPAEVKKYRINIEVNDSTDSITAVAGVEMLLKEHTGEIALDLASQDGGGAGMVVDSVFMNGERVDFIHKGNDLFLPASGNSANMDSNAIHHKFPEPETGTIVIPGDDSLQSILNYDIYYHGIPRQGLIISTNKFGDRTYFADNWPNRAHNWFPCIDHPSQRAEVDFIITAPSHYQVIATGTRKKTINLQDKRTMHYWSSSVPVPVKVMVFAAAEFAMEFQEDIDGIPYSNWVYPDNMEEGFSDFQVTPDIIRFFTGALGPYPFEKIANVQSTTEYGGMENAGNIFYHENSITGQQLNKLTIVHEIAHQWFGNSVSETDWPHLWLSEGIVSWLTHWYVEQHYGHDEMIGRLVANRENIIEYSKKRLAPVVDYHTESYSDLLNPNTYQKGAWVLHMLRRNMGEEKLVGALVEFYERYKMNHACTDSFMQVLEEVSGEDLDQFFDDWLYSAGHPVLSMKTSFSNGRINIELVQVQQHKMAFSFPLDVRFVFADGSTYEQTFDIDFRRHEFLLNLPSEPVEIIFDPDTWLLFEQKQP